jgi:hypothetical protein
MKIDITNVSGMSDIALQRQIQRCHHVIKNGTLLEGAWEDANKSLPILRQEQDKRDQEAVKGLIYDLFKK